MGSNAETGSGVLAGDAARIPRLSRIRKVLAIVVAESDRMQLELVVRWLRCDERDQCVGIDIVELFVSWESKGGAGSFAQCMFRPRVHGE